MGNQERTNFEEGSLPQTGVKMLLLARLWLQLTGCQRSSLGLVLAGWAAGNNPLGCKQVEADGRCVRELGVRLSALGLVCASVCTERTTARAAKLPSDFVLWGTWLGQGTSGDRNTHTQCMLAV